MHSRWGIEAYGRHAIAIPTPPFVDPKKERIVSTDELVTVREDCLSLAKELSALRERFPL